MNSLIQFDDLKAGANTSPRPSAAPAPELPHRIEQLRQRLLTNYPDSVDVKIAVLAELIYCCYGELLKRSICNGETEDEDSEFPMYE